MFENIHMMLFWQNNLISIEMNKFQVSRIYQIRWFYNNFQRAREFVEKQMMFLKANCLQGMMMFITQQTN